MLFVLGGMFVLAVVAARSRSRAGTLCLPLLQLLCVGLFSSADAGTSTILLLFQYGLLDVYLIVRLAIVPKALRKTGVAMSAATRLAVFLSPLVVGSMLCPYLEFLQKHVYGY